MAREAPVLHMIVVLILETTFSEELQSGQI